MGKVDLDFTANYTREDVKNRPGLGDSQSNVGKNLMTLAGTYNQAWLQNYENADGTYANWNGNDQYNKNPYWDIYKNGNTTAKDVFRLSGRAVWNVTKNFKVQGTVGTDMNNLTFEELTYRTTPGAYAGKMQSQIFNNKTLNAELLTIYTNNWGDWDLTATAGGNVFYVNNATTTFSGLEQQMDNVFNIMNYAEQSVQEGMYRKQINSVFASASIGYDRTYYLEATLRGDKSSTLPVQNNIYVYPSVSASWVFTEYLQNKNILSYGKLRASWAQVGSDTDPYQLALNYGTAKYSYPGSTIGMINNSTQPNFNLKPTMTSSYKLGLEMKFFNGRILLGKEPDGILGRRGLAAEERRHNTRAEALGIEDRECLAVEFLRGKRIGLRLDELTGIDGEIPRGGEFQKGRLCGSHGGLMSVGNKGNNGAIQLARPPFAVCVPHMLILFVAETNRVSVIHNNLPPCILFVP
jgi:hypothetical protein